MLSMKLVIFIMISLYLSNAKSIDATASKKISMDGRCGKEFGHCREGYCCSKIGWCGNSDLHCNIEEGCQSEFGQCHGIKPKDTTKDINESSEEEEGEVIHGKCGKGYGSCKEGYCCSKYGWCGKSDAYCRNSKGCQSDFGMCVFDLGDEKPVENDNESSDEELPISKDGKCGKGIAVCEEGYCCSKYGWCGKDDLYCQIEKGCQIEYGECSSSQPTVSEKDNEVNSEASEEEEEEEELPISKDGRCGKGIAVCGEGNCCSSFGWCGNTKDHCKIDRGCQTEFGSCYSNKSNENVTNTNNKNEKNKPTQDNNKNLPISKDGRCGKDVAICNEGYCCSKYGWCGKTDLYCKIEEGCQLDFGECNPVENTDDKKKDKSTEDINEFSDEELPVSTDGRCGKGVAVCGDGNCCSSFGWCGKTKDHCKIDRGCQTEFGKCESNHSTTDGKNDNNKDKVIIIEDENESSDEENPTNEPTEVSEEETFDPNEYYFFN